MEAAWHGGTRRDGPAAGTVLLENVDKRKATTDGEDLFTPQVRPAPEAVAEVAAKP